MNEGQFKIGIGQAGFMHFLSSLVPFTASIHALISSSSPSSCLFYAFGYATIKCLGIPSTLLDLSDLLYYPAINKQIPRHPSLTRSVPIFSFLTPRNTDLEADNIILGRGLVFFFTVWLENSVCLSCPISLQVLPVSTGLCIRIGSLAVETFYNLESRASTVTIVEAIRRYVL